MWSPEISNFAITEHTNALIQSLLIICVVYSRVPCSYLTLIYCFLQVQQLIKLGNLDGDVDLMAVKQMMGTDRLNK